MKYVSVEFEAYAHVPGKSEPERVLRVCAASPDVRRPKYAVDSIEDAPNQSGIVVTFEGRSRFFPWARVASAEPEEKAKK